jgi:hypothetical protein
MMRFGKRLLRPIYRTFFERPIWWFLSKVKIFFFAETSARLENIERRLSEPPNPRQEWAAIEERLRAAEAGNAAQWDAIERLLLAFFQQPEQRSFDSAPATELQYESQASRAAEVNGVNGPNNIR